MNQEALEKSYGTLLHHSDTSQDEFFNHMIDFEHLTWRPWIGADWFKAKKRILIVGESHYATASGADNAEEKIREWQTDSDGTREIVLEVGIGDWYASRFFGNLHRALFGEDIHGEKRIALWRNLAFCNFIQRPMRDPGERPRPDEFFGGWRYFMDLLKKLRPEFVLFVGVTAAKHFSGAMSALGIEHEIAFAEYRNGAYPCKFSATYDGMTTEMVAIRHTSQYFAWEIWRDYLAETMPEGIAFLRKVVGESEETKGPAEEGSAAIPPSEASPATPPEETQLEGLPTWLAHKPVMACNYQEINDALGNFDYDDPRFISVGHAQWNPDEVSVKIFRVGDSGRWSRQSEEVPVQRLPYMMAMLLSAIQKTQNPSGSVDSGMNEKVVAPQDLELLREQLHVWAVPLKDGLTRVKELLEHINIESI